MPHQATTPRTERQASPTARPTRARPDGQGSPVRSPVALSAEERAVLDLVLRRAEGGVSGPLTVPVGEVAAAAELRLGDVRELAAVLRSLAGRVVEWTSPESRTIAPLLAEVGVEGDGCRFVLSPALRRRLSSDEPEPEGASLRPRLVEFGLTEDQVERVLGLPTEVVERNLAYVEGELARGREIGALGAYTYRAIEGDWGGSAEAARRKRAAVRREVAARVEATKSAVFPPPALARSEAARRAEDAEGQRLDEHLAGLTDAERADLDAQAVQQPRDQAYWGAGAVERALASGVEGDLGPAANGALTAARRDVMADWLRRGTLAVLVGLSALVGGCSPDGPEAPPPDTPPERASPALPLLGVWDLADVAPELGDCHEGSIGFRSDGRYLAKSGGQVVTGRYVAEPAVVEGRAGFLVVQRPEVHNGRPNCQGVPADVSLATSPPAAFVEVEPAQRDRQPERARLYFGGQAERPALHLVRRTLLD